MLRISHPAVMVGLLLAALPRPGGASEPFTAEQRAAIVQVVRDALKQDPSILRDAIGALRAEDQQRQAARLIDPADPVGGNLAGDVTIVEFFDVRCPFCRRLEPSMAALLTQDRGVRLVYKDMPILGPSSVLGARALLAAQRQDGYERLRAAVMAPGFEPTEASLKSAARGVNLDWRRLRHDMDDPAIARRIAANLSQARALGVEGTPALVIGGELLPGAVELPVLRAAVAEARAKTAGTGG